MSLIFIRQSLYELYKEVIKFQLKYVMFSVNAKISMLISKNFIRNVNSFPFD